MPPSGEVTSALTAVSGFGDYFHVATTRPADPVVPVLADVYAGDPVLLDHIRVVSDRLRTKELRVGGSILFQGLAARLWSPVLAVLLLRERVLELDPATTWWSPELDAGRLHVLAPRFAAATSDGADEVARTVVELHLRPLAAAVRAWVSLPEALLWGNAASALVGSLGVVARARPDLGGMCGDLAETLVAAGPLAGAGRFTSGGARTQQGDRELPGFVRTSCCLYYRVPGGGLCGDCALTTAPATPEAPPPAPPMR